MTDDTDNWSAVQEKSDPRTQSRHNDPLATAYRALLSVAPISYADPDESLPYLATHLDHQLRTALEVVDAEIGPRVQWTGAPPPDGDYEWSLRIMVVDFDLNEHDDPADAKVDAGLRWGDTGFSSAATAYRRECRWDFAPGEAGVWVIAVAPYAFIGGEDEGQLQGNLVSMVIAYDRDEDGEHEAIGHLWTATGWRRRGIATALLKRTRELLPIRTVEGPYTKDGKGLLTQAAPDLLSPRQTSPASAASG